MHKHIGGAVGALVLSWALAAPAEAHNFDSLSWSTCYAQRGVWTQSATVAHSHPDTMVPGLYVDYYCCFELASLSHRYGYATRWANGATSSHDFGPVYGGDC